MMQFLSISVSTNIKLFVFAYLCLRLIKVNKSHARYHTLEIFSLILCMANRSINRSCPHRFRYVSILCYYLFQVLAADGEIRASRALKEAADIVSASPSTIQLHLLHTMHNVSKKDNNTIVLPIPRQIMQMFTGKQADDSRITKVKPLWRANISLFRQIEIDTIYML